MDNVTHTLAGVIAGDAVLSFHKPQFKERMGTAVLTASVIANNAPDLDFLYAGITPGKLGYLLHHRGHTHTILGAVILAVILTLGAWAVGRIRKKTLLPGDLPWIGLVSLLGGIIHISLDSLNIYGVHPFWPFSSVWVYGDALFIIEPFLWLVGFAYLATKPKLAARGIGVVGIIATLAIAVLSKRVLSEGLVFLAASSVGLWLFFRRRKWQPKAWMAFFLFGGTGLFFMGLSNGVRQIYSDFHHKVSKANLNEVLLSALPTNPFCWAIYTAEEQHGMLRMKRGLFAPFPELQSVKTCPFLSVGEPTAKGKPIDEGFRDPRFLWRDEVVLSHQEFLKLAEENCEFRAFLIFARAPFFQKDGESLIVGDVRFDHDSGLSFSESRIKREEPNCPRWLPPWTPPRQDWLQGLKRANGSG